MTVRDIGDLERIGNHDASGAGAFATTAGGATDPTTVTLTVQKPDGTQFVYGWPVAGAAGALTHEAAGRFYADVTLSMSGRWAYRLVGTGAVVAAAESWLVVPRTLVTP